MTAAYQRLSATSVDRYRVLVGAVAHEWRAGRPVGRVGLPDRKNDDALAVLDLESGELRPSGSETFDIIVVEQPRPAHRRDLDFIALKARLAPDGLILLRRRSRLARWWGRLLSRRRDDAAAGPFGAGRDRREAALRRASLYLTTLSTPLGDRNEEWLVASAAPLADTRFRDQIGRVATDYLRTLGPVGIGIGATLPGF